jgi:TPR repeat protein
MPNRTVLVLSFTLFLADAAFAGQLEDGYHAASRGDDDEAVRMWMPLAEQGLAEAQFLIGAAYDQGRGTEQDKTEAAKWYRRAGEQGDPDAQFNLGLLYDEGEGVPLDDGEAIRWYRLAADQGYAPAMYNLGFMHFEGEGVDQDYTASFKWFRLAAVQGYVPAANKVGLMYAQGVGAPEDLVKAHMWFNLAAAKGHAEALKNRVIAEHSMTPDQIAKAQRLARKWTSGPPSSSPSSRPLNRSAMNRPTVMRLKPKRASTPKVRQSDSGRPMSETSRNVESTTTVPCHTAGR